ncbi:MAG: AMP-binding protein, partial [bacterium]|nr:AMP-binding protein [bacterium]
MPDNGFAIFDVAVVVENIHDKSYLQHIPNNVTFLFRRNETNIQCTLEYATHLYKKTAIQRVAGHFTRLLSHWLSDLDLNISALEMLREEEKNRLLDEFNDTAAEFPRDKTITALFEEQVEKTPENIALIAPHDETAAPRRTMTYSQLNRASNQLARVLQKAGVNPQSESVVGIMMERSLDMVTGLMGTLKAGGAYLPIQPGLPEDRVRYMLEDSGVKTLLTTTTAAKGVPFTALRNFEANSAVEIVVTPPRGHIKTFDRFSRPDRSLLALGNYKDKIGMASVSNAITLQTTRGCPYECLYCHKIWSKKHVYRRAESIYDEIEYYYKKGVTNFAAIDDCFNLNKENSAELFRLIVKN